MRITCPPITTPHFGVDMGHDGDLMAARLTVEEMRNTSRPTHWHFSLDLDDAAITVDPGDEGR